MQDTTSLLYELVIKLGEDEFRRLLQLAKIHASKHLATELIEEAGISDSHKSKRRHN